MAEEYLDILNEKGEKTGERRTYKDSHKFGLLHRSVHVWILNNNNELLLQKRSLNSWAYPDFWDISASGHISSGKTSLETAKDETSEEVGLVLPNSAFKLIFTLEEHKILNEGAYISNEFQDIYLINIDKDLYDFKLCEEEVSEVQWIDLKTFKLSIDNKKFKLVPHDEEYQRLLEFIG